VSSYSLTRVRSASSTDFDTAYGALDAEFGSRGELERREVIARWLAERESYHLLLARTADGTFAGVRACHVLGDRRARVVYLSHALVLPPFRRTGLGALFRQVPIELAGDCDDLLLAAEMETDSTIRFLAYAKDRFAAIPREVLPYVQPDFSLHPTTPIPLVAVVRWVGHEDARALPKRLAHAYVKRLYEVFATHVAGDHLAPLEAGMRAALDAAPGGDVPLRPLI
jgi:hypothetical protein